MAELKLVPKPKSKYTLNFCLWLHKYFDELIAISIEEWRDLEAHNRDSGVSSQSASPFRLS